MKKPIVATLLYLTAISTSQQAFADASIETCEGPSSVANVTYPWNEATRTFANEKIRIVTVDTGGEPVCCSAHLVILAPDPNNELGDWQCKILSDGGQWTGFQFVDIKGVKSSYNASKGLLLRVPVERYIDGIKSNKAIIDVRINQATGSIVIE